MHRWYQFHSSPSATAVGPAHRVDRRAARSSAPRSTQEMFAKLALLFHNKVAVAVLGTLLIGGGTAVVAAAAANGATLPLLHQNTTASDTHDPQEQEAELHGTVNTVGNGSFTLKLADGSSKTVTVSAQT